MITVLTAPLENKVLLDANNSVIKVQSSNGDGYYFRALIYVNDVLFDTQGWSRETAFVASKDLKKLYSAYFSPLFNPEATTGLVEQTHLIRKINITINEHSHETGAVAQTVNVNTFYIMFNQNPVKFLDSHKAQFLDVLPDVMQVPLNGKISIPFFVNAAAETVTCSISDGITEFHTVSSGAISGKKAFLYTVDLSALTMPSTQEWFNLTITIGETTLTKSFRVFLLPVYSIKQLAFQNNFGFFLRAYIEGDLQIVKSYKGETYSRADSSEKVFEINEDATYTLNTGSLLEDEKQLIPQLCNSVDVRMSLNNVWHEMVNRSKRYREFTDDNHTYEEDIIFNLSGNKDFRNYFFDTELGSPPVVGDIAEINQPRPIPPFAQIVFIVPPAMYDPEGGPLAILWTTTADGASIIDATTSEPSILISEITPDNFEISVTATDEDGQSTTKTGSVTLT